MGGDRVGVGFPGIWQIKEGIFATFRRPCSQKGERVARLEHFYEHKSGCFALTVRMAVNGLIMRNPIMNVDESLMRAISNILGTKKNKRAFVYKYLSSESNSYHTNVSTICHSQSAKFFTSKIFKKKFCINVP